MQTFKQFCNESEDYRIAHEAPTRENGVPIYDLSGIYPEDFYSPMGAQYYGHYGQRHPLDVQTVSIIQGLRNRPNAKVKIYRAVPNKPTNEEQIGKYEAQKRYIMKYGEKPPLIDRKYKDLTRSNYYDYISDEIERLKKTPEPVQHKYTINKGDWITINRNYAKEHGLTLTGGNYQILTKTVDAKDLYTNGDSIHEFGYDPE